MAGVVGSEESDGPKLSEIFDTIWDTWQYTETTDEPTVSETFQTRVADGVEAAEKAISMVNDLQLFSDNEEFDEVATNEIKFMLLPALLGHLQMKRTGDDRMTIVKSARLFYTDFLHMCKNYSVTDICIPVIEDTEQISSNSAPQRNRTASEDLVAMNAKRQAKIERFKQQKQTEKRLKVLKSLVEREHVDDEIKRDYYTTLLKQWIGTSLEEIESIPGELEMLEHMAKMRTSQAPPPRPQETSKSKFRPFILTKSDVQRKVFGAGYPSLPTYTVEEYFDQQVALGNVPAPGSMPSGVPGDPAEEAVAREKEEEEKEQKVEQDDEEMLQKARSWDDWKDDHRRGWGNTQNMG